MTEQTQLKELENIIVNKSIVPVFQPIVSLKDGSVFGFEALSRVTVPGIFSNVEALFECASANGYIWQLEQVCRRAILREYSHQTETCPYPSAKLFINVDPKVLHDKKFQAGFTKEYIKRYALDADKIVFEITEREQIEDEESFREAVNHYKGQNYRIAIDDVGSGYSGLNRICNLSPNYIKLDIALVRDVYKNPLKCAMIKGMVEFSHNSGTLLIAEGIETKKELDMLIDLGVQYGQGYYLAKPAKEMIFDNKQATDEILAKTCHNHINNHLGVNRYYIKNLVLSGLTVAPEVKAENVLSYVEKRDATVGICVLEKGRTVGVLTREKLLKRLSGRYGFSLNHNKSIGELADKNFLQVDSLTSISSAAKMAMEREADTLYDFIVVKDKDKYLGIVTIQDLLKKAMEIDVDLAKSANPLTGLPGNIVIDQEVKTSVESGEAYTVFYFDLDNFKAFNDVYGFEKGDEVICILSDILKEKAGNDDFVGHIGGDDFVMICKGYPAEGFSESIRKTFEQKAHILYREEDRNRNYITTRNRHGVTETFPLVSVTIVSISNQYQPFGTPEGTIEILAGYKKSAKAAKASPSGLISNSTALPVCG